MKRDPTAEGNNRMMTNRIRCLKIPGLNKEKADSLPINHHHFKAALLFSQLMWEQVGGRYGVLYPGDHNLTAGGLPYQIQPETSIDELTDLI